MPRKVSIHSAAAISSAPTNATQARLKGKVVANRAKPTSDQTTMLHSQSEIQCPLCCEEMDATDLDFFPCPCGFKLCLFCYQRVQNDCNNLCPGCRRPYGSEVEQSETIRNNSTARDHQPSATVMREPVVSQPRSSLERQPSLTRQQMATHVATLARKPLDSVAVRAVSVQQQAPNDFAVGGLPPASSWATAQSLSRTTSLDSESTSMQISADELWPSLAESVPVTSTRSNRSASGQHLTLDHDAQSIDMEESQESFKSTAQVTSMVSGVRRAVCVPLSLAARAVEPYPEASSMLLEVKQAVRSGRLSSKDAAAQLVALLKEKESGRRGSYGAVRTPPGFADASFRNSTASPPYSAMDSSTASSASSSPFSQVQQNGSYAASPYSMQQNAFATAAPSVWTDSGLPGVSFSMGMPPSVPQTVQALWTEPAPAATTTASNNGYGMKHTSPYTSWNTFSSTSAGNTHVFGSDSSTVSRYAPPGVGSCQPAAKGSGIAAYKPLSLVNHA